MNRIKELRENLGVSQDALAKQMSVSQTALGNYERGLRAMDYELVKRLAEFFHVSPDYLTGFSDVKYVVAKITDNDFANDLATRFAAKIEPHLDLARRLEDAENYPGLHSHVYAFISKSIEQLDENIKFIIPPETTEEKE